MSYLAMGDGPELHEENSLHIPPAPVVFYGEPTVYYLAICATCAGEHGSRPTPMPFGTAADRATWVDGHRTTGHHVGLALEVRP